MINEFTLIVDKFQFLTSWESIRVVQSMENLCGSIAVKTTLYDPQNPFALSIKLGAEYIAMINGQKVGMGYIEEIPINYDSDNMNIEVRGRDKTCDLVDCTLENGLKKKDTTLLNWAHDICSIFKINLHSDRTATKAVQIPIEECSADIGQTAMDAIMKYAVGLGVMAISLGDGKLTLTKGAPNVVPSILAPELVLSASFNQSVADRYSKYIVAGMGQGKDEKGDIIEYISTRTIINDIAIKRNRPYIILLDFDADSDTTLARAVFEKNYRIGQSKSVEYVVEGWTKPTTQTVWRINEIVIVNDVNFQIFRPLLISEVEFRYDEGSGFTTRLLLVHPSTYAANSDIEQFNSISESLT